MKFYDALSNATQQKYSPSFTFSASTMTSEEEGSSVSVVSALRSPVRYPAVFYVLPNRAGHTSVLVSSNAVIKRICPSCIVHASNYLKKMIFLSAFTPCRLRGCKNRPTPFPGSVCLIS